MMRNDINIALVSMVRPNEAVNNSMQSNLNATDVPIHKTDGVDGGNGRIDGDGEFDWSTLVQSMILSSFYACYVLSQVREKRKKKEFLLFQFSLNSFRIQMLVFSIQCH